MHETDLSLPKGRRQPGGPLKNVCAGLVMLMVAACGSAPVQEMSEARQAIEAARSAGAEQHAPDHYRNAQALLKTAEQMLNDRHFRKARESAAEARDEAIEAREVAREVSGQ